MVQRSDFSTDKFREIQGKIESSVQSLRPQEEYKEFIEKYKSVHTLLSFLHGTCINLNTYFTSDLQLGF